MSESIHDPVRLRLSGPSAVNEATRAARGFARSANIDDADAARLAIVVEELVTNLYDHGGLTADDFFEIELSATDTTISLVLIDFGKAFDPNLATVDRAIPERGGGAGLKLVRAWASRAEYQATGSQNRLTVLLPSRRQVS
jgi:serine/threonine-protein kinase RsbW